MAIVEQAVHTGSLAGQVPNAPSFEGRRGTCTIEELARKRRRLFPEPIRGGPLAADTIRADRDGR